MIESLINRVDLSEQQTEDTLQFLLKEADEAFISAFLVLLSAKGETFEEIVGMARGMISHCEKIEGLSDAVDIVGTGGDGANTVNISTGASILAAAAGANVAKVNTIFPIYIFMTRHTRNIVSDLQQGNRSSSSACGSADVLEALGVAIDLGPQVSSSNYQIGFKLQCI